MKIVMIAAPSDIHCVRWANGLVKNNEVHILHLSNFKPLINELSNKVNLYELKIPAPLGYFLNVKMARKVVKNINPDIVHVHQASGHGTFGRLVLERLNIPSLLSVYGSDIYDFPYYSRKNMKIIKKNIEFYDFICSTSIAMANQINKVQPNKKIKDIFITPFGVDLKKFNFTPQKKLGNKIQIGSIKKLEPKYGIDYALLAINYLFENSLIEKEIEYNIFGDGSQKQELESLAKEKSLEKIVKFHSRIPNYEVPKVLEKMDIFLAPSTLDSESFGVSVVEAMAKGTSIVASDVQGFNEVMSNGECGVIVPKKTIKELALALKDIIENDDKRLTYIHKAIVRVEKFYDWDENVKNMEIIYNEALDRR